MKKIISILSVFLVLSTGLASAAVVPDEQFIRSAPPTDAPSRGMAIDDAETMGVFSTMQAHVGNGSIMGKSLLESRVNCESIGVKDCEIDSKNLFLYRAALDYCEQSTSIDCVKSVGAIDKNGEKLAVKFVENFPRVAANGFTGNAALKLPDGKTTFIVDIPGAPHAGGTQYLIVAQLAGHKEVKDSQFIYDNMFASIYAINRVSGTFRIGKPSTQKLADGIFGVWAFDGRTIDPNDAVNPLACAQATETECLLPVALPKDVTFSMSLQIRTKISGWLHGRITDLNAKIESLDSNLDLVTIEGKPAVVPIIFTWKEKTKLSAELQKFYLDNPNVLKSGVVFGTSPTGLWADYPSMLRGVRFHSDDLQEALLWIKESEDKAPYAPTRWTIKSTNDGIDPKNCFKTAKGLGGVVSTNSTFYLAGPPVFSSKYQTLDYTVASAHLLPNGEVFKGSYNLIIQSNLARCLYGFNSAPISASVSVINSDGTTTVASTTLSEKNGYIALSAQGFTFSSPTLRVKFTQKKNQVYTITCIKGKTSKKVTAVKPLCPTGYKKK
jgi:hypothetical protein